MSIACLRNKNKRVEEILVLEQMGGRAMGNGVVDYLGQENCGRAGKLSGERPW